MRLRGIRVGVLALLMAAGTAQGALFSDDEARAAIVELRQRIETLRSELREARADAERNAERNAKVSKEQIGDEVATFGRSLLDLQRQNELLRTDLARLQGTYEELARLVSDLQRQQKDEAQALMERLAKLEPMKVAVDGMEFTAMPGEKRDFELALDTFRKGDFPNAQTYFVAFINRYPASPYSTSGLFWLGNAQYALRDYPNAISNFRLLLAKDPQHLRAPEALLSVANCQLELKDTKAARGTLEELIRVYPGSEAAKAATERLAALN